MNYEQRYKEALKAVKELQEANLSDDGIQNWVNEKFPELRENEDERIRKIITLCLEECVHSDIIRDYEKDKCRAWLEKQSEQKSYGQREECIDCQFNYAGECKGSCTMKRSERKPADKVKPKFKISNWIINRTGATIMQIVNNEDFYESVEIGGQRRTDTYNYVERDFRLWSIEDAKDGDVLVHNGITFIFKGIEDGIVKGLCSELSDSILNFGEPEHDKDYYPATKEQRDFLFQKMKEAGYEWDAEKKELKKIENRPMLSDFFNAEYERGKEDALQSIEWSEEDDKELKITINALKNIGHYNSADWLLTIKQKIGG